MRIQPRRPSLPAEVPSALAAFAFGQRAAIVVGEVHHRAVPGVARRMGDAARRVPLRHRQGAVRQEDSTGPDVRGGSDEWISLAATEIAGDQLTPLRTFGFSRPRPICPASRRARNRPCSRTSQNTTSRTRVSGLRVPARREIQLRVEAVNRWYVHDWNTLDNKIRSSIVEGVSVFLSMFDVPSVARVFCPAAPEARRFHDPAGCGRCSACSATSCSTCRRCRTARSPPRWRRCGRRASHRSTRSRSSSCCSRPRARERSASPPRTRWTRPAACGRSRPRG